MGEISVGLVKRLMFNFLILFWRLLNFGDGVIQENIYKQKIISKVEDGDR